MEGFPRQSLAHPFTVGFLSGIAITAGFVALSGADLFPSFGIMVAAYLVAMVLVAPLAVMLYTSRKKILGAERYFKGIFVSLIMCVFFIGAYVFLIFALTGPP
jgi:hypothetical protein